MSWKVTGDTSLLESAQPAITFNSKLDMFVGWAGSDTLYFMRPDYKAHTLSIVSKHIDGGPTATGFYDMDGFLAYLPDHDAYLVFSGMNKDFWLLLPPGSPMH